ncbi:hypothetical protein L596_021014 [Steinernema carpocapsae]|uniref:Uncharacterized protein n=1 Tax=Steinernema carpocapsae TaxID=34508 RepID=A0A4U5MV77_STECR|nr:hypothetical protein L596_021014 [Steinernema carpocapsae]
MRSINYANHNSRRKDFDPNTAFDFMARVIILVLLLLSLFAAYTIGSSRFLKAFGHRNAQVRAFPVQQVSDSHIMKYWRLNNVDKNKNNFGWLKSSIYKY